MAFTNEARDRRDPACAHQSARPADLSRVDFRQTRGDARCDASFDDRFTAQAYLSETGSGIMVVLTESQILAKARGGRTRTVSDLASVKNLNLWGQNISDASILTRLPSLEVLSLAVNDISSLAAFRPLQNLTELYLRRNSVADPHQLVHLRELPKLRVLWLSENPLGAHPEYRKLVIGFVPQLRVLDDREVSKEERVEAARLVERLTGADEAGEEVGGRAETGRDRRWGEEDRRRRGGPDDAHNMSIFGSSPVPGPRGDPPPPRAPSELAIRQGVINDRAAPVPMSDPDWEFAQNGGDPSAAAHGSRDRRDAYGDEFPVNVGPSVGSRVAPVGRRGEDRARAGLSVSGASVLDGDGRRNRSSRIVDSIEPPAVHPGGYFEEQDHHAEIGANDNYGMQTAYHLGDPTSTHPAAAAAEHPRMPAEAFAEKGVARRSTLPPSQTDAFDDGKRRPTWLREEHLVKVFFDWGGASLVDPAGDGPGIDAECQPPWINRDGVDGGREKGGHLSTKN
ncbi:hypothetical protein BDK51DRAFT_51900 [Blyttiomyces helicus]|uniref:U2A'/phosphoprotein 32 family A C-terminal domain-containing protein n=1 Tax=Blyttiomyces helicus TaxID=388810 RepID=A0A4P9WLC5_9FUNG|nr:hypothetical protein BDK51DRAFT_51900 [Blyttiomyces helicus]|eukprot:RKO92965.1 hypothetical protein BDK51DRAFT_51900 [Blyttiomyces helicus]